MENGASIYLLILFNIVSRNTIHLKKINHEVGIVLILFTEIGKFALCIFFSFEKQALGKSPWKNGGDLLICHFLGLKTRSWQIKRRPLDMYFFLLRLAV